MSYEWVAWFAYRLLLHTAGRQALTWMAETARSSPVAYVEFRMRHWLVRSSIGTTEKV